MSTLSRASQTSGSPMATITASSTDVSGVTVAITTTFTPAATCNPTYLTQASSPGSSIWVAEPVPVPWSTASDCYPSEWIQNYATVGPSGTSSIAPFVSPLICPSGWSSAFEAAGGYIACCPDSYGFAQPSTPIDSNRPAYGGTCYSEIGAGSTVYVTAYNQESQTATVGWVVGTSGAQAYAHPIDGIAHRDVSRTRTTQTDNVTAFADVDTQEVIHMSTAVTSNESRNALSGGVLAGIVVGAVAGLALLAGLLFFLLRRARQINARRSRYALEADSDHVMRWVSEMSSEKVMAQPTYEPAGKPKLHTSTTTISQVSSLSTRSESPGRH